MSNNIQLLTDAIANQIAAGEVVQRPASVVKELLENAIDAGASSITLKVKDAGKTLIQVIDNGTGMSGTDARMCFERHATSKIRKSEDLFNIRTLGFRGEAMASIAAVAQVEMKTKTADEEIGTKVRIEGSKVIDNEPAATTEGTVISVKNLFFNVPARRNFLKSTPVEMKHIYDEFQRVSLAHPEIDFSLLQGDLEVYQLKAGKLSQRIVGLFGKNYQKQLVPVEEETGLVKIYGYVGLPENAKKTRGEQFFFANDRFIKHPYLHHAVSTAYEGLIADRTYPFYVLKMEIDPKHIDINVHPTKTEIKFDDERTIYAIMNATVKRALGVHNIVPSIDFEQDINFGVSTAGKRDYGNEKPPFEVYQQPKPKQSPLQQSNQDNWNKLFDGFDQSMSRPFPEGGQQDAMGDDTDDEASTVRVESALNQRPAPEDYPVQPSQITFQFQNSYIITQVKSGLIMIDQKSAHERILYEKFLRAQEHSGGASQQYLFPQQVHLSPPDMQLVEELKDEIALLGFSFEPFSNNAIVIQGIPADVPAGSEQGLFERFLEQIKMNRTEIGTNKKEVVARSLAKRSAVRRGQAMAKEELSSLIGELFACKNPNYSPDGARTFVILDIETIEEYFKQG